MAESISAARPATSSRYPWYDSVWLSAYQRAREVIRGVVPHRLREFESAFDALRTRPDFQVKFLEHVFDQGTLDEIRRQAAGVTPAQLEMHEARLFRRFVVHDHPYFTELHGRVVELASEVAGEPLEASYNFLSLYGPQGVCPLHLDSPTAKWTLDVCIAQSGPWPIHFGPVATWPEPGAYGEDWEAEVKRDLSGSFKPYSLVPGQAILFSGSSQWHYRDPMPDSGGKGFCDLLFFHFMPRGCVDLADPTTWAERFGIPELESS